MMPNWMKIVGVADGMALAAVTALGQAVPAWAPYTQIAVEILGVIGTVIGTSHVVGSKTVTQQN
jgi:hypothetical protein